MRVLSARAAAVERTPITFTADARQFALTASQLGVRGRLARRRAPGCGRGRRLRAGARLQAPAGAGLRRSSVTPPVESYDAAVRYKLAQIADVIDRKGVDARLVRKGLDIQVVESMSGRQLDRTAAAATVVAALARFDRDTPVALPVVTTEPKVNSDDLDDAATQARTALSAPIRLSYGETRWRVPRWRIAPLLSLPSGGSTTVSISGRPRREVPRTALGHGLAQAAGRALPGHGDGGDRDPAVGARASARRAGDREGDRRRGVLGRPADGEPRRAGRRPEADDGDREDDGNHERRLVVHDDLRRHAGAAQQRPARRQADRRHADRAGRHVLVQRHDGRADGGEGIPGGARDHQRRAPERARRRHLPGLDDGLQRCLRGRPADHRAHEPRALHLPLPARARRDRELPGHRPALRRTTPTTGCCCGRSSAPGR